MADVARPGSFLEATGRTFGRSPGRVAGASVAFAAGLRDGGVVAAAKHFPGLGAATRSTDEAPARLAVSAADLRRVNLPPFRALVSHDVPIVMLGTATYPPWTRPGPRPSRAASRPTCCAASWASAGSRDRCARHARPRAGRRHGAVAVRAAGAGSDMLLHTGYAAGTASAAALARAVRTGALPRAEAEAAVGRILARAPGLP